MIKIFYTLLVTVILLANRGYSATENNTIALSFYVVSEEKIEGGQFIDTLDLPKLGYIAAKPDLIITKLVAVSDTVQHRELGEIDKKGKYTTKPLPDAPAFLVTILPKDSQKFEALTKNNIGRRVLIMVGNKPLIAPPVSCPITESAFVIAIGEHLDRKVVGDSLKRLVR